MARRKASAKEDKTQQGGVFRPDWRAWSRQPGRTVLRLQRSAGNRAVQELLARQRQGNLRVSDPGEPLEQEAERAATRLEDESSTPQSAPAAHASAGSGRRRPGGSGFGAGVPLSESDRHFFEARLGRDLSPVRLHTGRDAAIAADALDARAFTEGSDVAFADGEYQPGTTTGRRLLAHELVHVAQHDGGVVARAVSGDYSKIESNLSYGLFDWAITDAEAHQVLTILSGLGPVDFRDTTKKLEDDGLLTRLLENVSDADQTLFAPLLQKIHQGRSVAATAAHIESLMSYGLLDWAVTDEEAHLAMQALLSLKGVPAKLRDVVGRIPSKQWERFFDNLSERDRSANLRFIEELEMIRRTGKTFAEMAATQKTFLEGEATAAGKTVGEFIRGEAASHGYGGTPATWWPSLTPPQKAAWTARFNAAVAAVKVAAPPDLRRVISAAEAAGGGIRFKPEEVEELGAFAFKQGDVLGVGKSWIESAETDSRDVFDNISHELGGHREYGEEASWSVMKGTLAALPPGERAIATGGARSPYTAYGYMETEIYAELRELPYRTAGSQTDDPVSDVEDKLTRIREAYEPSVAEAIVRGMRRRFQADAKMTDQARALFDEKVRVVFGITF